MSYGDIVRVFDSGPSISEKSLGPIGIHDKSICWGVSIHDFPVRGREIAPENRKPEPHLLISPIDPQSWPFAFRLKIELRHEPGAMARAAGFLKEAGVNILFAECTPTSFRHASWNVIGVADSLLAEHRHIGHDKDSIVLSIVREMLIFLSQLSRDLLKANSDGSPFLHQGLAEETYLGSFKQEDVGSELWQEHHALIVGGVKYRLASNLTYLFRCVDLDTCHPIHFRYSAPTSRLVADYSADFLRQTSSFGFELPGSAIASFNPTELYLRLQMIRQDRARSMVHIKVHYEAYQGPDTSSPVSSKGLFSGVSRRLHEMRIGVDLLHVENKVLDRQAGHEVGLLSLISSAEGVAEDQFLQIEKKIESLSDSHPHLHVNAKIERLRNMKIFVSKRLKSERANDIERFLHTAADELGIRKENLVILETNIDSVTTSVREVLSECDGMIQVVIEDLSEEGEETDLGWLVAEYAMAYMQDIPRIRVIGGATKKARSRLLYRLKLERDSAPIEFSPSDESDELQSKLGNALRQLVDEIHRADRV